MTKFFVYCIIAIIAGLFPPLALLLLFIALVHYGD